MSNLLLKLITESFLTGFGPKLHISIDPHVSSQEIINLVFINVFYVFFVNVFMSDLVQLL